jgi:DNA ligase-1
MCPRPRACWFDTLQLAWAGKAPHHHFLKKNKARTERSSAIREDFIMQGHEKMDAPLISRRQVICSLLGGVWQVSPVLAAGEQVQLAQPWPSGRSPQGFLISEKFDGVRAVWDGKSLRFRSGRPIAAPTWFLAALPPLPLDGELWMGRGQFDRVSGAVRKTVPDDAEWRSLKYLVFDALGRTEPFVQRVGVLTQVLAAAKQPWLQAVPHSSLEDASALQARLHDVVANGGEGLVLHRADAVWQSGRADALFKLKPQPDEEGRVLGYRAGKGRLEGLTGALLLETPQGQRFALGAGLSDALRRDPPSVGAWVTYRYRDRTPSGLPRFASFLRVREVE